MNEPKIVNLDDLNKAVTITLGGKSFTISRVTLEMRQLYGEIGRYISLNVATDKACKEAGKSHRGLIDVMAALRKSIQYNWKLAERR